MKKRELERHLMRQLKRRGRLAARARKSWAEAGLEPITLHEFRHTYATFLMAAGYTLKELMEYVGHSSL